MLDLGDFGDSREFSGTDDTRGGSFDGVILTLSSVPEPGSLTLAPVGVSILLSDRGILRRAVRPRG
jgi:hypothetical protein